MYYGGFNCREDIIREFRIKSFEGIVIHAQYDYEDYSGNAHVIFVNNGVFYLVHDSHCSCHGLEDWNPEEITPEALLHIIREGKVYGLSGQEWLANVIEHIADLIDEDSSQEQIECWVKMLK